MVTFGAVGGSLKDSFLSVYGLAAFNDGLIVDFWDNLGWNITFVYNLGWRGLLW